MNRLEYVNDHFILEKGVYELLEILWYSALFWSLPLWLLFHLHVHSDTIVVCQLSLRVRQG